MRPLFTVIKNTLLCGLILLSVSSYGNVFIVDNAANTDNALSYTLADGTNTLRKCIRLANVNAGLDNINFNLPGVGPYIISVATTVLSITDPVIINGCTQSGASAGNLLVQLNCTSGLDVLQLNAGSSGSTIEGLVIYGNNAATGIKVNSSSNHVISGNYIGTNVAGTATVAGSILQIGISLIGAANCIIGGTGGVLTRNIISGNSQKGLYIQGASTGTIVQGNYIGVNATGITALANNGSGIEINSFNTQTIGGITYTARNIISGNQNGINVVTCSSLIIKGNFIGLGADGKTVIPNTQQGINLQNPTSATTIGGLTLPERNIISGNQNGIQAANATGITIQNNYIGTDSTGLLAKGNSQSGINLTTASNTNVLIGGTTYSARNIISGNTSNGMSITNCTTLTIKGNFIGLGADGTTAIANGQSGINLGNPTTSVIIGGLSLPERNVIASSTNNYGINVSTNSGITIQNNYIGTDSTGLLVRGNKGGINISTGTSVLIGGTTYSARNLICSSTGNQGISLNSISTSVVIKGNFIGLAVNGITAFGNTNNGIQIQNSPTATVTLGGPAKPERNVISSNTTGSALLINGTGSASATIQNNYIGTDSTGVLARGNQAGINISATPTILIGGTGYSLRNIVSASTGSMGITISGCSTSVVIKGNFIGLSGNGTSASDVNGVTFSNSNNGITVQSSPNATVTLGGLTNPERNVISNNKATAMQINGALSATIQNNYIGTDSTGMFARGNQAGINISATPTILIGGTSYSARNIVSASNGSDGITISACSTSVVIKSNIIGLAADGIKSLDAAVPFGNKNNGITVQGSPNASLTVGGINPPERNIISSNLQTGLYINQCASATIQNNYIGTDSTGLLNRGNGNNGINANTCAGLVIGGTVYAARNLVCGSVGNGISINAGCPGAVIKANFCGIGKDGVTVISNQGSGIYFGGSNSNAAIIGGSTFAERNVSSGNGTTSNAYFYSRDGIRIEGGSTNHVIKGNYCGVDSTGTIPLGNVWAGISINEGTDCIVGGTGTYEGNISGDNKDEGVYFRNAVRTTFIGNFVGTDKTGTIDLGNGDYGVNIRLTSTDNVIGGASIADQNYIAYTKGNLAGSGPGVYVDTMSTRNKITRNKIYCNATKGIVLVNSLANEGIAAPTILTSLTNTVNGTGSINGDSIHVYLNIKSGGNCDCEGETFVGGTIVSGGAWSLTHNLALSTAQADRITATETTVNNSTSEFSTCLDPLPVTLISFDAKKQVDHAVLVEWSIANEQNNKDFEVQRSTDGVHFQTIEIVAGSGNSTGIKNYSIIDTNAPDGIVYYKLKQVDINGTSAYSMITSVDFSPGKFSILQNNDGFTIVVPGNKNNVTYQVYSITGSLVAQGSFSPSGTQDSFKVNLVLAPAMYMVSAIQGNNFETQKIIVSE